MEIPKPPNDFKMIDVILKGKDTRLQVGGYVNEIEELKKQLTCLERRVVKVGKYTIVVAEVAAIIE